MFLLFYYSCIHIILLFVKFIDPDSRNELTYNIIYVCVLRVFHVVAFKFDFNFSVVKKFLKEFLITVHLKC